MCVMNKYVWKSNLKIMLDRRWIQEMNNESQTSFSSDVFIIMPPPALKITVPPQPAPQSFPHVASKQLTIGGKLALETSARRYSL